MVVGTGREADDEAPFKDGAANSALPCGPCLCA